MSFDQHGNVATFSFSCFHCTVATKNTIKVAFIIACKSQSAISMGDRDP